MKGSSDATHPLTTVEKEDVLRAIIARTGSMIISFSGGVDSALLGVLATGVLGDRARCVLLDSPVVPRSAIVEAEQIARMHHLALEILPVGVMGDERFTRNPAERCYWCKKNSAEVLKERKEALGFACVADGINISDLGEHRPGHLASTEEGIVHPFIEAGITKAEIRTIAQSHGFWFWNKPSAACLSSRIPYGDAITPERLLRIEEGEAFLHAGGFSQCRVRLHGDIARIEVEPGDIPRLLGMRDRLVKAFGTMGFAYCTLDLEGYRSGSMDEVLHEEKTQTGSFTPAGNSGVGI